MDGYEMSTFGHPGTVVRHSAWRRTLILLAVLALTISLASRYTAAAATGLSKASSMSADSASAKTQHLLGDGLQWTAPVAAFLMLVVPRTKTRILHPVLPVINLHSEDWLYNRPPPFC
jgi:hypothetical protein